MEKYGDASANLKLQEEREAQKERDKYLKRKIKSSPVVKKSLLNKVMKIIKDLKL